MKNTVKTRDFKGTQKVLPKKENGNLCILGGQMAGVNKQDIPLEARFMTEFWDMVKKFWIPEDADEYWKGLSDYANRLYEKYPTDFCKGQIVAYAKYLNEKYQKLKKG
jgi:hypothetical protein